ncbi:hypothetical protein [Mariniblastus fucicola]|nr:hypothetical protein [Mariniblastus fucicola]
MELTEIFAQLSRWAHIIAAIVLTGGTLFMRFALVPAMLETSASEEVQQAVRKRWMKWVAGAALFLLVSGFYNAYLKAIGFELSPIYNGFLGAKILLGFFAFWLSATLVGRSERAKRFREREIFWLNILTSVVLVIVLMAGFMKMDSTDYVKKVKSEPVTVVEE